MTKQKKPIKWGKVGMYAFLILASFLSVFPLYWMAIASTNTSNAVLSGTLLPGTYLLENLKSLTTNYDVVNAMWNSFRYAALQTLLSLLICSLAGYGFEVFHDKHKDRLMAVIMLAMMIPQVAIMVPLFKMMSGWGFLNKAVGFILPSLSTPFLIMLFRSNARTFPVDIIDAARVDGVSEVGIFFKMFMPVMKSTYAAAMTITFMNAWNAYLWPKVIMTKTTAMTMPMLISNMTSGYMTDYGMLMLGVLLCSLPTIIIFFLLQKSFANGIAGAVK